MSDHTSTITDDGDGWYDVACSCGFSFPGVPGAETAADIWADHKVEVHTAELESRLPAVTAERDALRVVLEAAAHQCSLGPERTTTRLHEAVRAALITSSSDTETPEGEE